MSAFPEGLQIVTGGGGAIGSAIAGRLVERGAGHVLVCDIDGARAKQVATRIGGEALVLDLADPAAIDDFLDHLRSRGTPIAGLVHCAAVFGRSSFPDISWQEWQQTLAVNLVSAYRLDVGCMDLMGRGGAIVHVTSVEAFHVLNTGGGATADYAASKGGLQMLTKALASDLAPRGIRVNAVAPGYIGTPINAAVLASAERREFIEERIPLEGRIGTPEDIAGPVTFLLSHDASYVTGATLVADGGLTLGLIRRPDAVTPA